MLKGWIIKCVSEITRENGFRLENCNASLQREWPCILRNDSSSSDGSNDRQQYIAGRNPCSRMFDCKACIINPTEIIERDLSINDVTRAEHRMAEFNAFRGVVRTINNAKANFGKRRKRPTTRQLTHATNSSFIPSSSSSSCPSNTAHAFCKPPLSASCA